MTISKAVMTGASDPLSIDDEWSARIRQGDYEAFESLFRTFYAQLVRFARLYAGSTPTAEEIVQDTFASIWEHREGWQPRGSVKTYLYGAVRRQAGQHHRRREVRDRWLQREGLEEAPTVADAYPETDLYLRDLQRALDAALADVPERRRTIFLLSRNHGLTYAEIAALLGISVKTVDTQIGRVIKFLRNRLSRFFNPAQ